MPAVRPVSWRQNPNRPWSPVSLFCSSVLIAALPAQANDLTAPYRNIPQTPSPLWGKTSTESLHLRLFEPGVLIISTKPGVLHCGPYPILALTLNDISTLRKFCPRLTPVEPTSELCEAVSTLQRWRINSDLSYQQFTVVVFGEPVFDSSGIFFERGHL